MIQEIDDATSVAPIGAYTLTSSQKVVANNFYKGLSVAEGFSMNAYLHLRAPHHNGADKNNNTTNISAMAKSREFLDMVANDAPKGAWSLKHDAPNNLFVLRSLLYPGYVHFNVIGTPVYGSRYVGTGLKTWDLAFML
jgi:hypothetical protein